MNKRHLYSVLGLVGVAAITLGANQPSAFMHQLMLSQRHVKPKANTTVPTAPIQSSNVVNHKPTTPAQHWSGSTIPLPVRHHSPIHHQPVQVDYQPDGSTAISAYGVNAIVSTVKMDSFVPSPHTVTFQWIDHNHGLAFELLDPHQKSFQAIVTFANDHLPVSLWFTVDDTPGRVITLPREITGSARSSAAITTETETVSSYDQHVVRLMQAALSPAKVLGAVHWQAVKDRLPPVSLPAAQLTVRQYQQWAYRHYVLDVYQLCNRDQREAHVIDVLALQKLPHLVAFTLKAMHVAPGRCTRLLLLRCTVAHPLHERVRNTRRLGPAGGEVHG